MERRLFISLFLFALGVNSAPVYTGLWPKPQSVSASNTVLTLDPSNFNFKTVGYSSDILNQGFQRYEKLIFYKGVPLAQKRIKVPIHTVEAQQITSLAVNVLSNDITLGLQTNETYTLNVQQPTASITAATVYGALRALETFSQLVYHDVSANKYFVNGTQIVDFPRFQYRGVLLDSSRHYLPLPAILEHLDAMEYNKMNVFHWHIVDDQSFPYQSVVYPELSGKGAYNNVTHIYTPQDVAHVIEYAQYRGIRVIPEFDTPGHTLSWGDGYPELLTPCYTNGKPDGTYGPINPTRNSTYQFMTNFFKEVANTFIDDYVHIGGDEVSFDCWETNPECQAWMKAHGYTDYSMLEQFYETNLLDIVGATQKSYIVWQEIFDNGLKVKPDTVIEVWKSGDWESEMARVTAAGLRGILASCWYLNYISYGQDWPKYYTCDPQQFNGTAAQKALVMGGSAAMWGEYVDSTNVISRTWPRASAVAERLWSAADVTNVNDATIRIADQRCRLVRRNIRAEPANGPSFCEQEYDYTYIPPY